MENNRRFLQKLKIELSHDPSIPPLGIYLEKTLVQKDTCTPIFIAALFTIAKPWKKPKCPWTDDRKKKMWYICTMEYYSAIKKNKLMPSVVTWMGLEIIIVSGVSQRKTISYDITYMRNLQKGYKGTYLQNRNWLTDIENKLRVITKGEGRGGMN